jgi:two-component system, NtrC family, sensor histidine kinase PilS
MNIRGQLQVLIIVRLLLISLVSAAALSTTVFEGSTGQFLRLFLLVVYILSGIYFLFLSYTDRPEELYSLQFFSDLVLISLLIYASGGSASPFTPLYVLIIVYSSLIRYRRGAVYAVALSIISYLGVTHLEYFQRIPATPGAVYTHVLYRVMWNLLGFVAVALLGSFLSERLQKTRLELGAVKMLHDNIVNSIRTGLITLDSEGRITSLNRAAGEIFGRDEKEVLGKSLKQVLPPVVLENILATDFTALSLPLRSENWLPDDTDRRFFVGTSCSPLFRQSGDQIGYILSCQDLTEIKKREEELQLKEKMAAIGQVAAGVAHEIRNPLAALSGSIQILRSELTLLPDQRRLIEIVLRECSRLNQTVADFLTYAGPAPPRFQSTDLSALVQETVTLFENHPEFEDHHSIEVHFSAPEAPCLADPDQLRQAVWNILQNGVRAMPHGGRIAIQVSVSDVAMRLTVRDEGIGMTEEEQSKVFQPFHTGFKKGVGLGMAIVYQIVQQHNGSIEIESCPNRGTTVSVLIPPLRQKMPGLAACPPDLTSHVQRAPVA